jgi:hypothetical protein
MRLSSAIRIGSRLRPQAFGHLISERGSDAFGAAAEASGCRLEDIELTWFDFYRKFPIIFKNCSTCPVCSINATVGKLIAHLNDDHRWTRECIADWVETIEAQES